MAGELTRGTCLSEERYRHKGNKQIAVWIPAEAYDWFSQWLDRIAAGETFAGQFRSFLSWVARANKA